VTAGDLIRKLRERKAGVVSVLLHVLVFSAGMWSFSARSVEPQRDLVPVGLIGDVQSATKGVKTGKKESTKPLADKIGEEKPPIEDPVSKVDKKEVITSTSAPEQQKPAEKPVEKTTDSKTKKEESKQADKKPDQKANDPIADKIAKEAKNTPAPKKEAKATPQPTKPKEYKFDPNQITKDLQDKRDPSRQSITGAAVSADNALGTRTGNANAMVATWIGAFRSAVANCFKPPYNGLDADQYSVDLDIKMRLDGTLASDPVIVAVRGPSRSIATAVADSAKRAIIQCQAYAFLPKAQYETWKTIELRFGLTDMM
jgi:outer membrane biosynthesis protein TonB